MSKLGNEGVQKNSGGMVGIREIMNFIEGANVTLTIVDDPTNGRVNITIASAGGAGTAWLNEFAEASDPDSYYGTYATMIMQDSTITTIRQTFMIPTGIVTITRAAFIIIPEGNGDLYWSTATNFGQICSNEDYQTHTDSIALNASTVTLDEIECIDFSAALTGAAGGDIVGIEFVRDAEDALDTIGADVHFLGIIIQGAAE